MHHVSLIIEFLRGRPAVVFWTVALTQALLWTFIPAIFYSSPPGDVPLLLAIGHEFVLGSYLGPPLAFWLGEIAFRFGGLIGLYALSQVCIVTALWAVFTLGRSVVGTRHAVLGILLMVGVAAFAVPSPDFGPAVLAAPLWALALLHYWRAVGLGQRGAWFLLALDLGLLLLANYVGVILLVLLIVFTLATARGRRELVNAEPWIAFVLFFIVVAPHAAWLYAERDLVLAAFNESRAAGSGLSPGTWLVVILVAGHLGLVLLRCLGERLAAQAARTGARDRPSAGGGVRPGLRLCFCADAGGLRGCAGLCHWNALAGWIARVAGACWCCCTGLAVVVATGDRVLLYREGLVSSSWLALLVAPPLLAALSLALVPWIVGRDLRIAQPAKAEAQFLAENYQRRTGKPLAYVTGDERLAPLIALMMPGRPRVFFAWAPKRSPWISVDDVAAQGSVLVWPAEVSGQPPATLKTQFPDMVAELPRAFDRAVQGRLPPVRLGWSVLRPLRVIQIPDRRCRGVRKSDRLMIALAFAHFAAEQPVHQNDIADHAGQQQQRAEQHENLARCRRRGIPDSERRRHQIGKAGNHQTEIAEHEQRDRRQERRCVALLADPVPARKRDQRRYRSAPATGNRNSAARTSARRCAPVSAACTD